MYFQCEKNHGIFVAREEVQEVLEPADEFFEVEQIIDQKEFDGETKYFVKWKGYDEDANTWEPLDHIGRTQAYQDYMNQKMSAGL